MWLSWGQKGGQHGKQWVISAMWKVLCNLLPLIWYWKEKTSKLKLGQLCSNKLRCASTQFGFHLEHFLSNTENLDEKIFIAIKHSFLPNYEGQDYHLTVVVEHNLQDGLIASPQPGRSPPWSQSLHTFITPFIFFTLAEPKTGAALKDFWSGSIPPCSLPVRPLVTLTYIAQTLP